MSQILWFNKSRRAQSNTDYETWIGGGVVPTLNAFDNGDTRATTLIGHKTVRRLTPVECERLQGFPDNWTAVGSDSQRYKQMGNAVTVNVIEWIGKRLDS
jgi:DNA (cytosine-5)-methyltransferase 1